MRFRSPDDCRCSIAKKGFEGTWSVDEARSATSPNEPAKKLRFLRRSLHHERGGETQQEKCCASGAKQYWHPSRLITLSFFTFLRHCLCGILQRSCSGSCQPFLLKTWDLESLLHLLLVGIEEDFQNCLLVRRCSLSCTVSSGSQRLVEVLDSTRIHLMSYSCTGAYSEHARSSFVSPTLETTLPACSRFSTSGLPGKCPTAAVSMNSPSASRLSSSHSVILS